MEIKLLQSLKDILPRLTYGLTSKVELCCSSRRPAEQGQSRSLRQENMISGSLT
jgi:hypothetical protein